MNKVFEKFNKFMITIMLILALVANVNAAIIADNDASAFITKAEFNALRTGLESQVSGYLNTIDAKIDYTIANYLNNFSASAGVINNYNLLISQPKINGSAPLINVDGTDDPVSGDWQSMELSIWAPNTYSKNAGGANVEANHTVLSVNNSADYPVWSPYALPTSLTHYGVWTSEVSGTGAVATQTLSQRATNQKGNVFVTDTSANPKWMASGGLGTILYNKAANTLDWLAPKTTVGHYYLNANVVTAGTAVNPAWVAALDSTTASALSTNQQLVTERDVYNGLPYFNDKHDYTENDVFYPPTTKGTEGQYWRSDGSGQGQWTTPASVANGNNYFVNGGTYYTYNQTYFSNSSTWAAATKTASPAAGLTLSNCQYTQVGSVVYVGGWFELSTAYKWKAGTAMWSGLPEPSMQIFMAATPYLGDKYNTACIQVASDGKGKGSISMRNDANTTHPAINANTGFTFGGIYIAKTPRA